MTTDPGSAGPEKTTGRKRSSKPPKPIDSAVGGQKIKTRTETESVPVESPEEVASRLRRDEARESHDLFKEKVILIALLIVTGVVVCAAVGVLIVSDKPNAQAWAMAVLSSVLTGYFGWFTGKQGRTP